MPSSLLCSLRRAVSLLALLALPMCRLTHIDVSAGGQAAIPHATIVDKLLGNLSFTGFDKVDFTEEFANQGVTKDQVNSVRLKTFTLTVEAPAGGNFDFLESVAFFAEADGVDKVEIASLDSIPKGMKELHLIVNADAELEPFVVAPSLRLTSEVQGSLPNEDTTVSAEVVLDVDVHVPGCG